MNNKEALAGIFFDVGDTLIYDSPSFIDTCIEIIESEGITPNKDLMKQYVVVHADELNRRKAEPGLYTDDEKIRSMWGEYFGDLIAAGAPALGDCAFRFGVKVYDAYNPGERWAVFSDTITSLKKLTQHRFVLHVVSDWGSYLPEILVTLKLDTYFSEFHISTQIHLSKDGPEMYNAILKRTQLASSEVIMVGDSCLRDIKIPSSIDIRSIQIDRRHGGRCAEAYQSFQDLTSATKFIIKRFKPKKDA